jgi:hypothetical protein
VFYPVDDSHLPGGFFDKDREETQQWLFHPNATQFIKAVIVGDMEVEVYLFVNLTSGNHIRRINHEVDSLSSPGYPPPLPPGFPSNALRPRKRANKGDY